jgi:catechol 2,3-dioxygenase-like lactoylglutathione lyase family enzyme
MQVTTHSIGFTVSDLARSRQFYTDVLSFEVISEQTVSGKAFEQLYGLSDVTLRMVQLQLGDEVLELTEYSHLGKPIRADARSCDRTFQHLAIVVSDMTKAYEHLQQNLVQNVSTQPQKLPDWNEAVAEIEAFYFQDPDGHNLELISFPSDKGRSKWHQNTDQLFLGDVTETAQKALTQPISLVSAGVVKLPKETGFQQGVLLRDPDGHGMKLIGKSQK